MNDYISKQLHSFTVLYYDQLSSTQSHAKTLCVQQKELENTVIVATSQTQGRGRFERVWQSSPGKDLLVSIILKPKVSVVRWSTISLIVSICLVDAIKQYVPDPSMLAIKWPNDILYEGQKCAGILAEIEPHSQSLIVGFGVNVNSHWQHSNHRCSLKDILGKSLCKDSFLAACLSELSKAKDNIHNACLDSQKWNEYAAFIGQKVHLLDAKQQEISGVFLGVDDMGSVQLRDKSGAKHSVINGSFFRTY